MQPLIQPSQVYSTADIRNIMISLRSANEAAEATLVDKYDRRFHEGFSTALDCVAQALGIDLSDQESDDPWTDAWGR